MSYHRGSRRKAKKPIGWLTAEERKMVRDRMNATPDVRCVECGNDVVDCKCAVDLGRGEIK